MGKEFDDWRRAKFQKWKRAPYLDEPEIVYKDGSTFPAQVGFIDDRGNETSLSIWMAEKEGLIAQGTVRLGQMFIEDHIKKVQDRFYGKRS